jgi:hypothetical protein
VSWWPRGPREVEDPVDELVNEPLPDAVPELVEEPVGDEEPSKSS